MNKQNKIDTKAVWSDDVEHLLPKLTSLICEGVSPDQSQHSAGNGLVHSLKNTNTSNLFHLHGCNTISKPLISNSSSKEGAKAIFRGRKICVTHHQENIASVRSFIGGLSHYYNDLLMGIWGNISLIGLILDSNHDIQYHLKQIENLIQNGSNLLHLLFGYIIERRTTAKKLRLKQIMQEINAYHKMSGNEIDINLIESSIIELSKITNKAQLSACIARVINQMLTLIREQRMIIDSLSHDTAKVEIHLKKIDSLLRRGFRIVQNLQYYSAAVVLKKEKVNLKTLVRHQASRIAGMKRDVKVTLDLSSSIPWMMIDSNQIIYAIKQLVDNAVEAVADDGKIHIRVNGLSAEPPRERCGVRALSNYTVITVSDNGDGMATQMQAKIFDPFFTGSTGQARAGLGLTAAAGIIKIHDGYIQVRSKAGQGSTFKIYLP